MDIIEQTRQLGAALQADGRYVAYRLASDASDGDDALQDQIREFNLLRMKLNGELSKEQKDDNAVKTLNTEMRSCYQKIMENPNMAHYNLRKQELDGLVSQITGILSLCVAGEDPATCDPSSCTGSCETCGGCG